MKKVTYKKIIRALEIFQVLMFVAAIVVIFVNEKFAIFPAILFGFAFLATVLISEPLE